MLSYSRGPQEPLFEGTISDALRHTVERFPENAALISRHQNVRLTFGDLWRNAEATARGLAGMGLGPKDRIGVWATNCAEWVLLQLAAARLGAVLVNVNPAYRGQELAFVLKKSRMRAIFLFEKDRRSNYSEILKDARTGQDLELRHAISIGSTQWATMLENGTDVPREFGHSGTDVTNIQYTSGTTGSPKGILLTHRNLINNACVIRDGMKITERDRICVPVPLYHCFGCVAGSLVSVLTGATMILPAATFEPLATMEAIEAERATTIYGVPTMFIGQLEHPEFARIDFQSLRSGVMAGAPCPIEVMKRVVHEMHCPEMTIMYGQTESSPVITMSGVDDSLERRVATVGKACANTEIKIIHAESGETVEVGEQGELCTRGYLVMEGYDQELEATQRAIDADGWLHTGDLATMRADEYVRVTGRAKDLIIRGGENIYPREVEDFLYTHPNVTDVQVVGLPDVKLGEVVAAWVRVKEPTTEEELRRWCDGKIAHFKIPTYIRFVEDFPLTVTGKVQKFKIRQREIELRGLEHAARIETA